MKLILTHEVDGLGSPGDIVEVKSRLLEIRDKSIRFMHEMRNAETGEVAATCEITAVHLDRQAQFLEECARWVAEGRLRYREDIAEGLENAPAAFIGLLEGRNFGKQLVRVAVDPTRR